MTAGVVATLAVFGGGTAGLVALTQTGNSKPKFAVTVGEAPPSMPAQPAPSQSASTQSAPAQPLQGQWMPGQEADTPSAGPSEPLAKPELGQAAARSRTQAEADRTAPRTTHRVVPPAAVPPVVVAPARPVVTTKTQIQTTDIPYQTQVVRDPTLPDGMKQVQAPGVTGVRTLRYLVTFTNGQVTGRRLLSSTITRQPQAEIVGRGDDIDDPQPLPGGPWHGHGPCRDTPELCAPFSRSAVCSGDSPSATPEPEDLVTPDSSASAVDSQLQQVLAAPCQ